MALCVSALAGSSASKRHWQIRARSLARRSSRVAASMLTDVYYLLRDGVEFHDLGRQHFVQHCPESESHADLDDRDKR